MGELTNEEMQWFECPELGQQHLVNSKTNLEGRKQLADQLSKLDQSYPGGLRAYVSRAKKMMADSKAGVNPMEDYTPEIPEVTSLTVGTDTFHEMEDAGIVDVAKTIFCLVAGGLGERLGYSDIKVALPTECTTHTLYLQLYCETITAHQARHRSTTGESVEIPLVIMTSDDTNEKTIALLETNNYFGLKKQQVYILKQEKIPAMIDDQGKFATHPNDSYSILTKPHGHGDVHTLLLQSGIAKQYLEKGFKWIFFFQDTNGLSLRTLPSFIGVSKTKSFNLNFMVIRRNPGEAVGSICRLKNLKDGSTMTANVEYNQLVPVLKAKGWAGDVADENGYSHFPGNCNIILFALDRYYEVLHETGGAIPEFINPKYTDDSRTVFKTPSRLECGMQDLARLYTRESDSVGVTQLERWFCFSTLKNKTVDAAIKSQNNLPPECALSAEADQYHQNCHLLTIAARQANCQVEVSDAVQHRFLDVNYPIGPRVVLHPTFGLTLKDLVNSFQSGSLFRLGEGCSLVVRGRARFAGLDLSGALCVNTKDDCITKIENLTVKNAGSKLEIVGEDCKSHESIRGYRIVEVECEKL